VRYRNLFIMVLFFPLAALLLFSLYQFPPLHDRLAWRVNNWWTATKRSLTPSEKVTFLPQGAQSQVDDIVQATLEALSPTITPTPLPYQTATNTQPGPTPTPIPPPTSTPPPTPIPEAVALTGIRYEHQSYNNCGPANLSMALSYWDWDGNQNDTRAYLRPSFAKIDDKNVNPAEMVTFVENFTDLKALVRVGGNQEILKRFIAAGFPVLLEKGHHPPDDWWMGHYLVLNGYDDEQNYFLAQDSLTQSDLHIPYEKLDPWWRNFNYVFLIIYPLEREAEVHSILGPHIDTTYNYQHAAQIARDEIPNLNGRNRLFALYNLGTNLVAMGDYSGAVEAYDQAFMINANLPEKDRLYRMLWYQDGPYHAYYYTGRYDDVVNLGNATLAWVGAPTLEETYYWMGLAREAQGNMDKAIYDFKKVVEINPNNTSAHQQLQRLGVEGTE
jgi:tetratricopeptide (TPR) repeat protein